MPAKTKRFKRGRRVSVSFEGIVIDSNEYKGEKLVRISVRPKPYGYAFWAVVPESAVEGITDPKLIEDAEA